MAKKDLHPTIKEFKQFVRNHPGLIQDVRNGNNDWQAHYEKWVLLGEDDPSWEKYKQLGSGKKEDPRTEKSTAQSKKGKKQRKDNKDKQELVSQLMKVVENVDINKVQDHINQLNGAISNVQTLIGQFKGAKEQSPSSSGRAPFNINKD